MAEYDADVPAGIMMTSLEAVVGWLRKTSFWPLTMGLACCAIEMISYGAVSYTHLTLPTSDLV